MHRRHRTAAIVAVLALAAALVLPAVAYAGPVREYQLQYSPTGDAAGALMIVSALVDPELALPVTISVPVPSGAKLLWAGEVLGGDPAADPTRDVTVETRSGMDVYTLTLEQAYTAQIEIQLPLPQVSAKQVKASVAWTNPGDEVLITASVVAEPGAADVTIVPKTIGERRTNAIGESLYPVEGRRVATGEVFTLEAEWKRGGEAAVADAGSGSLLLPVLLGLLAAAVLALVAVLGRERTRARRRAAEPSE